MDDGKVRASGAARLATGDHVRIVALTGSAEDHVVRSPAARRPQVGDVGTVVDIADRLGGVGCHYSVVCRGPDASTVWLAVFSRHELELVAPGVEIT